MLEFPFTGSKIVCDINANICLSGSILAWMKDLDFDVAQVLAL